MRHTLPLLLALLAAHGLVAALPTGWHATDSCWRSNVKTAYIESNGRPLPCLRMGGRDRLMLRFDVLDQPPAAFRYRIQHCDRRWHVDDLEPYDYLNGFEEANIDAYQHSFGTLQQYVHYSQLLPDEGAAFLVSGNYVVSVFEQHSPDSILLTLRFCVYEDLLGVEVTVDRPMSGAGDLRHDQEVAVALAPRTGVFIPNATQALEVRMQQNGRTDNMRTLPFTGYEGGAMMYRWREENVFAGGNCFRHFDISNLRSEMYNVQELESYAGEHFAVLRPDEMRSGKPFVYEATLNGGMKVNAFDRHRAHSEADYVWVNFSLPIGSPYMDGSVHIVGALTQWALDGSSRMDYDVVRHAYHKRMLLKQGYYAYLLLFLPIGDATAYTKPIEGNHYETPNDYTAFVYLRLPSDRGDRLAAIGFK